MHRIAVSVRIFAFMSLVNLFSTTSVLAQACSANTSDAFTSVEQSRSDSYFDRIPHKPISDADRIAREHDPFTYVPFFNDEVDIFNKYNAPDLIACAQDSYVEGPKGWDATYITSDFPAPTLRAATTSSFPSSKIFNQFDVRKHRRLITASQKARGLNSHFYLAQAQMVANNWDGAWQQGEFIFKNAPENEQELKRMMDLYFDTPGRYMEYCIWCTRYLRVVKDWPSFALAYDKRKNVEWTCRGILGYDVCDQKLADEPIDSSKLPIAVCFNNTADGERKVANGSIFEYCAKQFDQWVVASGFKLCFYAVENSKDADITVEIKSPNRSYVSKLSGNRAPIGFPLPPPLGETRNLWDKSGRPRRLIELFIEDAPDYSDSDLARLCLHEIGHAIGLWQHTPKNGLSEQYEVMNAVCLQPVEKLSQNDCWRIRDLYKKAPISLDAINQFALKMNPW